MSEATFTPEGLLTFDTFLKTVCPPPAEDHPDRFFYESWGYEQWLIKTYQRDIAQFRVSLDAKFQQARLAAIGKNGEEVAAWAREHACPLVEATESWTGFVFRKVEKGLVGIALWIEDDTWFCIFPKLPGHFHEQYIGPVHIDRLKFLDESYHSDEQVIRLSVKNLGGDIEDQDS
jgi:hypothetical protein